MNFRGRRRWIGKAIPLFRTCRGQTTILEDTGSNVEDETDGLIDGWKAQSSMDELPLKRQGATARVTKPK